MKKKEKPSFPAAVLILSGFLILMSVMLLLAAVHIHGFADSYAKNFYPLLVRTIGRLCGLVPFSIAELALYAMVLLLVFFLFFRLVRLLLRKQHAGFQLLRFFARTLLLVSFLLFSYTLGCGINYRTTPFSTQAGLSKAPFTKEQLSSVCTQLTDELVALSDQVPRNNEGVMQQNDHWQQEAALAMQHLASDFPALDTAYPQPKLLLSPAILSWQQVSGVYSPFTIEANVNTAMTPYNLPFTMCHELSHLSGFMREDEANFIAWLACHEDEDPSFRYSGTLLAWIYCYNALEKQDPEAAKAIRQSLPDTVEADLSANRAFWKQYDGPISDAQTRMNDKYLKANGQSEGVVTYDRFVELLVNYLL